MNMTKVIRQFDNWANDRRIDILGLTTDEQKELVAMATAYTKHVANPEEALS